MFSRYLRSVVEWDILAGAFAFGAVETCSIGNSESTAVGVEGDSSGVPEVLILLFGWERLPRRLEGLPPSELARARGNFRCDIFCNGDGYAASCSWYEVKFGG